MKRRAFALAGLLAAYAGSYAANSALGGYWPIPDDAETGDGKTLGESEDLLWQGRAGYYSARWSTTADFLYGPLARLDWKWVHKPHRIFAEGGERWYYESGPLGDFHPRAREYVRLTRILKSKSDALKAATPPPSLKDVHSALENEPEYPRLVEIGERLMRDCGRR
jgi:hypothetical protein